MRSDTRDLMLRMVLMLIACWAFTVALVFGIYFAMRFAFGLWR